MKGKNNVKLSFEDFITNEYYKECINLPLYMNFNQDIPLVDYVAKYENLNSELQNLCDKIGIPFDGTLKVYAKGNYRKNKQPYQNFFSGSYKKYRNTIAKEFQKEIELLGYTF